MVKIAWKPFMLVIGRFTFGRRIVSARRRFCWFYHPLLKENEDRYFKFFVWIGWHFYCALYKRKEDMGLL